MGGLARADREFSPPRKDGLTATVARSGGEARDS